MGRVLAASGARLAKAAVAAQLRRSNAVGRSIITNPGVPQIRSTGGLPDFGSIISRPHRRSLHTLDTGYVTERLSKAISQELSAIRSDLEKKSGGMEPVAGSEQALSDSELQMLKEKKEARVKAEESKIKAAGRKKLLAKKSNLRKFDFMVRSLRYISSAVSNLEMERVMRNNGRLWLYVVCDRILAKMPRVLILCFMTLDALWLHLKSLYPFGVLFVVLCSFNPVQLYRIAVVAHAEYVESWTKKLTAYEEKYLKKLKGGTPEAAGSTSLPPVVFIVVSDRRKEAVPQLEEVADPPTKDAGVSNETLTVVDSSWSGKIKNLFARSRGASDDVRPPVPPVSPSKGESSSEASKGESSSDAIKGESTKDDGVADEAPTVADSSWSGWIKSLFVRSPGASDDVQPPVPPVSPSKGEASSEASKGEASSKASKDESSSEASKDGEASAAASKDGEEPPK